MWKLVRCRDHRGVINFFHNCEERLREVRNENWESYDFTFDAAGYVVAESGFDGAVSELSDKVGNLHNDPDKKLRKYLEGDLQEKENESHIINETVEKMGETCGLLYGDEKGHFHLGTIVELPLYPVL